MRPDARRRVLAAASAVALYASCGSSEAAAPPQSTPFSDGPKFNVPRSQETPESYIVPTTRPARVRPARASTRPRSTPPASPPVSRAAVVADDVWAALARCESEMRQDATSPNGQYLSFFQWALPTWRSVGGVGDPRTVGYDTQVELAKRLQARSGWGQWPRCSRKLGLG